jgi:hypothetical protein
VKGEGVVGWRRDRLVLVDRHLAPVTRCSHLQVSLQMKLLGVLRKGSTILTEIDLILECSTVNRNDQL